MTTEGPDPAQPEDKTDADALPLFARLSGEKKVAKEEENNPSPKDDAEPNLYLCIVFFSCGFVST